MVLVLVWVSVTLLSNRNPLLPSSMNLPLLGAAWVSCDRRVNTTERLYRAQSNQEVESASTKNFSVLSSKGKLGRAPPSEIRLPVMTRPPQIRQSSTLMEPNWVNSKRGPGGLASARLLGRVRKQVSATRGPIPPVDGVLNRLFHCGMALDLLGSPPALLEGSTGGPVSCRVR